jgi:hypothetical protein
MAAAVVFFSLRRRKLAPALRGWRVSELANCETDSK